MTEDNGKKEHIAFSASIPRILWLLFFFRLLPFVAKFLLFGCCSLRMRARSLVQRANPVSQEFFRADGLGHWPAEPEVLGSNPNGPATTFSKSE